MQGTPQMGRVSRHLDSKDDKKPLYLAFYRKFKKWFEAMIEHYLLTHVLGVVAFRQRLMPVLTNSIDIASYGKLGIPNK